MELLIHIGFPKTGNITFHYLYLKSKEINYVAQNKNTTYRKSTGVFERKSSGGSFKVVNYPKSLCDKSLTNTQ